MKNLLMRIKNKAICAVTFLLAFFTGAKSALADNRGEGFVDTAIKILMAVVIGALVLAGLYLLFNSTVLPTLTDRVTDMFDYNG